MRAPVLVFPRTRTPSQGRGYLDAGAAGSPEAFGLGIAKGADSIGAGLTDLATVYQDRNDRVNRFKFLTDYSKFQTESLVAQEELERTAPLESTDLPAMTTEAHDKRAVEFRKTITDPRLQAEFDAKDAAFKGELTLRSVGAQRKKQDMFQTTELDNSYNTWANRVKADRTLLPQAQQELTEQINSTTLSPEDKIKTAHLYGQGLLSASYGNEVEDIRRNSSTQGPPPNYSEGARSITTRLTERGLSPMLAAVAAGNMQQESGFRTWAHNAEEGAHGLIQWRLSRWEDLQAAAAVAGKDWRDTNFQLDFFLREFKEKYPRSWHRFITATTMEEANAAMKQYILYGDDSQGTRLANAKAILNGDDPKADLTARDDTAAADMEALNSNPLYDTVPLDDRQAMANAADAQIDEEERERAAQATEEINAKLNTLFVGLHDGTMDMTDVQEARKAGWLSDIQDIEKADSIMADRARSTAAATDFQSIIDNGGVGYNGVTMGGEGEVFGKWVGEGGMKRISERDDEYMNKVLLPAVEKVRDVPVEVVGLLESMSRNRDSQTMLWALGQLSRMSDTSREGLLGRVTDDLQMKIDNYSDMVGSATQDELIEFMRGGNSPERVRATEQLDKQANAILNDPDQNPFKDITNPYWWWNDPELPPNAPEVGDKLSRYVRTRFKLNYRATGDADKATESTIQQAKDIWGSSTFGGSGNYLMELPIEKVYAPIGGSWKPYETQIRSDTALGISSTDTFRLVADQTTSNERDAFKTGKLGRPPSYGVLIVREDGTQSMSPRRWRGDPAATPVEEEE